MRDDERCGRSNEVNTPELFGQRVRVTMLRFSGSSRRDSVGRGQLFSNRACDIFHQDNAPVNNSILVTDYLTKMGIKKQFLILPIVQALLPVTFGYSLSTETVVMRQLKWWKRLWRRSLTRSHKRTSMGSSRSCWNCITSALQPEELQEFQVCTLNKSAHTKKKKIWKLI